MQVLGGQLIISKITRFEEGDLGVKKSLITMKFETFEKLPFIYTFSESLVK